MAITNKAPLLAALLITAINLTGCSRDDIVGQGSRPVIPHTATRFEYIPNAPMIDLFAEDKNSHGSA
ncbi:MAG: hypothetical protein ABFR65_10340, partial [Pseudomonadota bacterium]